MLLTLGALLVVSAYSAPLEQLAQTDACAEKQGLRCGAFVEAVADEIKRNDSTLIPSLCLRLKDCTKEQRDCAELTSLEVLQIVLVCNSQLTTESPLTSTASTTEAEIQSTTETSDPTTTTEEFTTAPWTLPTFEETTEDTSVEITTTDASTSTATEATTTDSISTTSEPIQVTFATEATTTTEVQTSTLPEEPTTSSTTTEPVATTSTEQPTITLFSSRCQQYLLQSSPSDQEQAANINTTFHYYLSQDVPREIKCILLDVASESYLETVRRVCGNEEAYFIENMINIARVSIQCEENSMVFAH